MKFRPLGVALLLAAACASASAENLVALVTMAPGGHAKFSAPPAASRLLSGSFGDSFGVNLPAFLADIHAGLDSIGLASTQDWVLQAATPGVALLGGVVGGDSFGLWRTEAAPGPVGLSGAADTSALPTPLVLAGLQAGPTFAGSSARNQVTDTPGAAGGGGPIGAVPIPEPALAVVFLAGLAIIGSLVRRLWR